jgi:hypothetical protein
MLFSPAMRDPWPWRGCYALCSVLLLAPLWLATYPPLVDAPQHAAQIAIAHGWSDASLGYAAEYELNWLTNSVVAYGLAYLLAFVLPVVTALKVVLSLALLAVPLVVDRLVRELDGDPWWVFVSFPIGYGYAFFWGFLNFVVAVPIGLLLVLFALRYARAPSPRGAIALAAAVHLLFISHVLVLAYAGLVALLLIWLNTGTLRDRLIGAAALASVVPLTASWWIATKMLTPGSTPMAAPTVLGYGVSRLAELPAYVVGMPVDAASVGVGLFLIAAPLLMGARPSRQAWRWAPLAVTLLFHLAVPLNVLDTAFVYPRFTIFVIPGLLLALDRVLVPRLLLRYLTVGLVVLWLAFLALRFHDFDDEARPAAELIEQMEPGKRVLSLVISADSAHLPWHPYLHFPIWYQSARGGIADFSFAEFFPNRFRYREGRDPPLPYNVEWAPYQFDWRAHDGQRYDYFLIRRGLQNPWDPLAGATTEIELVDRRGSWWLYRQRRQTD